MTESGEFAMMLALGVVAIVLILVVVKPLVEVLLARLGGNPDGALMELHARLDALEDRAGAIETDRVTEARVAELEERVDFAERLLASHPTPQPHRLAGDGT